MLEQWMNQHRDFVVAFVASLATLLTTHGLRFLFVRRKTVNGQVTESSTKLKIGGRGDSDDTHKKAGVGPATG